MNSQKKSFKLTYRGIVYITTLVSYIAIFVYLLIFTINAPGNYHIDDASTKTIVDIIFAILLLANSICILLSLIEFVKSCYQFLCKQCFSILQLGHVLMGLYPIVLMGFICNWDFSILLNYLTSPIHILLG